MREKMNRKWLAMPAAAICVVGVMLVIGGTASRADDAPEPGMSEEELAIAKAMAGLGTGKVDIYVAGADDDQPLFSNVNIFTVRQFFGDYYLELKDADGKRTYVQMKSVVAVRQR